MEKDPGLGAGWEPAGGEAVTITLTNSNGAADGPAGPLNGTTDASGSFLGDVHVGDAWSGDRASSSTSLNLGSAQDPIVVQTNGQSGSGSDATKTFVDARIHITPDATNEVGQPHTFTAFVEKNLGLGGGWVAAAGEPVSISLTNRMVRPRARRARSTERTRRVISRRRSRRPPRSGDRACLDAL